MHSLTVDSLPKISKSASCPDARTESLEADCSRSRVKSRPRAPATCSNRSLTCATWTFSRPPGRTAHGRSIRRLERLGKLESHGLPVDQAQEHDRGPVVVVELELLSAALDVHRGPLRLPGGRRCTDGRGAGRARRSRQLSSSYVPPSGQAGAACSSRLYRKAARVATAFVTVDVRCPHVVETCHAGIARRDQARSKRSRFITLFHAATKARTNAGCASAQA